MKKIIAVVMLFMMVSVVSFAEEVDVVEKSEAMKNYESLFAKYNEKKQELAVLRDDILRLEGAVMLAKSIVDKENNSKKEK